MGIRGEEDTNKYTRVVVKEMTDRVEGKGKGKIIQ